MAARLLVAVLVSAVFILFSVGLFVGVAVVYRSQGLSNFVTALVFETPVLSDLAAAAESVFEVPQKDAVQARS